MKCLDEIQRLQVQATTQHVIMIYFELYIHSPRLYTLTVQHKGYVCLFFPLSKRI